MTDLRKTLEQSQAITEGATYGPWRIGPMVHGVEHEDGSSSYRSGIWPGEESGPPPVFLTNDIDRRDATFIAHARSHVERANRALLAVLELHAPTWKGMPWGQVYPDLPGCSECDDDGFPLEHPCATVVAIQQHLGADDE